MKKLVVVGHGDAPPESDLSNLGREQSRQLGKEIKSILNGNTFIIATSSAARAKQTGALIAEVLLGFPEEPIEKSWLFCADILYPSIPDFIKKLGDSADIVILVTHDVSVQTIVRDHATRSGIPCPTFPRLYPAHGFMVDHEARTVSAFPAMEHAPVIA